MESKILPSILGLLSATITRNCFFCLWASHNTLLISDELKFIHITSIKTLGSCPGFKVSVKLWWICQRFVKIDSGWVTAIRDLLINVVKWLQSLTSDHYPLTAVSLYPNWERKISYVGMLGKTSQNERQIYYY